METDNPQGDPQEPVTSSSDSLTDILARFRQRTTRQLTRAERILRLTSTILTIGHNLLRLRWATPGSWEDRQRKLIMVNSVMALVNPILLSRFSRFIPQRPPRLFPLIMQLAGITCTILIHRYPARAALIRRIQWMVFLPIGLAATLPGLFRDLRERRTESAKRRMEMRALLDSYHLSHPQKEHRDTRPETE